MLVLSTEINSLFVFRKMGIRGVNGVHVGQHGVWYVGMGQHSSTSTFAWNAKQGSTATACSAVCVQQCVYRSGLLRKEKSMHRLSSMLRHPPICEVFQCRLRAVSAGVRCVALIEGGAVPICAVLCHPAGAWHDSFGELKFNGCVVYRFEVQF